MIFSKTKIIEAIEKGWIRVDPFNQAQLGQASYDLILSLPTPITLRSGDFIVLETKEKLTLSAGVGCLISTRGSAASRGINVTQASFFVNLIPIIR